MTFPITDGSTVYMVAGNVAQIVGQTPLIRLDSISKLTGCEIYGKAEFLNPGGSVKDRAAKGIIEDAENSGLLKKGMTIYEGTAGNTGIGLATVAAQKGYKCKIVMPDNQAPEKYQTLKALGAEVVAVKPVPFADSNHFYHTAKRLAETEGNAFWANQFENTANCKMHYTSTGPEIWHQTQGKVDFFTCATGTGGTLAGVSLFLKEKKPETKIILVDPNGSGMANYIKNNEIKSTGSSVTEGIGIMRVTANFRMAKIDDAVTIDDQKMISMLYHLAAHDGLLVGTSSGLNVFSAYELAKQNRGSGKVIVTILCDSALRYQSRVFNSDWLAEKKLYPQPITNF